MNTQPVSRIIYALSFAIVAFALTACAKKQSPDSYSIVPTTQHCYPSAGPQILCLSTNPPLPSGRGSGAWSPSPYWIKSEAAPKDYVLKSARFELLGPNACVGDDQNKDVAGNHSVCHRTFRDPLNVTWDYSIEGETIPPPATENGASAPSDPAHPGLPPMPWLKTTDGFVEESAVLILLYEKASAP